MCIRDRIKMWEAIDSLGFGGYIELATGRYIPAEWYSNQQKEPEFQTGLSHEDYMRLDADMVNYLRVPVFRCSVLAARTALSMGVSREKLIELGMNKTVYWDLFHPNDQGVEHGCEFPDDEWAPTINIRRYMQENDRYIEYGKKNLELAKHYVREWYAVYGIEVVDED